MMSSASPHLDLALPASERASLLLERMTLREKCFQITSTAPWLYVSAGGVRAPHVEEQIRRSPGFVCNFGVDDPHVLATAVEGVQRIAVEETRLGIPLLFQAEALSGFLAGGHMVFPTPTGLAATWSPDLVEEMTDLIRRQMLRAGVRHALSPNLDLGMDPRWGRVHETFGEDPYLVAAMGVSFVRGLQSSDLAGGVVATAKHFIGYGSPEGGGNLSAFEAGPRRIRDLYAFPFEAAIHLTGLASVMNSYSDVDGTPAAASPAVLTGLLRETLGFTGFVSADYGAIEQFVSRQRAARTPAEAGRLAIQAGLDTEFPTPYGYGDTLLAEVEAGRVHVDDVNRSVHRVLDAKFRLGLFEHPYPAETIEMADVKTEGADISLELARRSIVLLENDGILPLRGTPKVAVVGPHAEGLVNHFATYSYPAFRDMMQHMSSGGMGNMIGVDPAMVVWNNAVFAGGNGENYLRSQFDVRSLGEAVGDHLEDVVVEQGCGLREDLDEAAFDRAVNAAVAADVVVLALGGASLWFNGARTEGEGSDSAEIDLPQAQVRLADAIAATGTPVIAILMQGRAYTLPASVRSAAALIVMPYSGPFGSQAVTDVVFGDVSPSGRLPYSIPRTGGQIPVYHHQRNGTGFRKPLPPDVDRHYLDVEATPLYAFGQGLSFTSFQLTNLDSAASMDVGGSVRVEATVTNTGSRAGATVVQLYASAEASGVTRPAQQLMGFLRVHLEAGAAKRVLFDVSAKQFGYTALDNTFVVDPGEVTLWLAFDSTTSGQRTTVRITGSRLELSSAERDFFSIAQAN